jgi:aspartate/methionine/tyrosine aminotransferase
MNVLAEELNRIIKEGNPYLLDMLSQTGKKLFFPQGILRQSAEASRKARTLDATIGIAKERGSTMHLDSVMNAVRGILPRESLTYASSFGIPELRALWLKSHRIKNPSLVDKITSLPIVASGITHAISVFTTMWVDPQDVVILPEMIWGNYGMIFNILNNAVLKRYSMFTSDGGFNLEAFENTVRSEAKQRNKIIVLLNCPHNPTGYTVTHREADAIVDILADIAAGGTNVVAVADDAYFGLFYEEDTLKESIFSRLCDKHPRLLAVKLDGATKENYVWGLRVGFITYNAVIEGDKEICYDALEKKTAGCIRGSISNASHLGQSIVLKSMQDEKYPFEKKEKFKVLKKRALKVKEVLKDSKYDGAWDVYPFNSGYFMCLKLCGKIQAETLRQHLLEQYGVGVIAMGEKNLRVAFSCIEVEDIPKLFDIIFQGINDIQQT